MLARSTEEGRRVAAETTAAPDKGLFGGLPFTADEAEQLLAVLGRLRPALEDF